MIDDKITPSFRKRLETLGESEKVCVVVALDSSVPPAQRRLSRSERYARLQSTGKELEDTLIKLQDIIDSEGGKVLGVSRPLSMVTLQAPRALIERLSHDESVRAIMENQSIKGIDTK